MFKIRAFFLIMLGFCFLMISGKALARQLAEADVVIINDYCKKEAEDMDAGPGFESRCRQRETASLQELYKIQASVSERVMAYCTKVANNGGGGFGFLERCIRREMAAEAELNAAQQSPEEAATIPEYDSNDYCKRLTRMTTGSAMIESACLDAEKKTKAHITSIEIPPQVMSNCKRMVAATGQVGSYQLLDACIREETKAAKQLEVSK